MGSSECGARSPLKIISNSKLATLLVKTDDGHNECPFPIVTRKLESRSEGRSMEISFPSYPESLVFYEHFKNSQSVFPNRLSFVYLKGDRNGVINHNFGKYTQVLTVDISDDDFGTVASIFRIVSQLPKCNELRIFLSEKNIRPSGDDLKLLETMSHSGNGDLSPIPVCEVIEKLEITQVGHIHPKNWSNNKKSRLNYILKYAKDLCPKLKRFVFNGLRGSGTVVGKVSEFLENLPIHKVTLLGDTLICLPVAAASRQQPQQVSVMSGEVPSSSLPFKRKLKSTKESCSEPSDGKGDRSAPGGSMKKPHTGAMSGRKLAMKDLDGDTFNRRDSKPSSPH